MFVQPVCVAPPAPLMSSVKVSNFSDARTLSVFKYLIDRHIFPWIQAHFLLNGFMTSGDKSVKSLIFTHQMTESECTTAETARLFPGRSGDGCVTEQVIFTEKKNGKNPFVPIEQTANTQRCLPLTED